MKTLKKCEVKLRGKVYTVAAEVDDSGNCYPTITDPAGEAVKIYGDPADWFPLPPNEDLRTEEVDKVDFALQKIAEDTPLEEDGYFLEIFEDFRLYFDVEDAIRNTINSYGGKYAILYTDGVGGAAFRPPREGCDNLTAEQVISKLGELAKSGDDWRVDCAYIVPQKIVDKVTRQGFRFFNLEPSIYSVREVDGFDSLTLWEISAYAQLSPLDDDDDTGKFRDIFGDGSEMTCEAFDSRRRNARDSFDIPGVFEDAEEAAKAEAIADLARKTGVNLDGLRDGADVTVDGREYVLHAECSEPEVLRVYDIVK